MSGNNFSTENDQLNKLGRKAINVHSDEVSEMSTEKD